MLILDKPKLGFKFRQTNIGMQKINGFALKSFKIVLASFYIEDKLKKTGFFQETFLFTNTNMEIIFIVFF